MKGGTAVPWWGNQSLCINWFRDGTEVKAYAVIRNNGRHWSRYLQNLEYLFRKGATWSDISTAGFAVRLSPGGFIHDVKGMGCYTEDATLFPLIGVLNSKLCSLLLSALNPTVSFQAGDVRRLPVPLDSAAGVADFVATAIERAREGTQTVETTFEFISPSPTLASITKNLEELRNLEADIDQAVSRLYGLDEADISAIEREIATHESRDVRDEGEIDENAERATDVTPELWSQQWVSYAVGLVFSRFEAGVQASLGRGNFSPRMVDELAQLTVFEGILVSEQDNPLDLAPRILKALKLMLGESGAREIIKTACGKGDPEEQLRAWLDKQFWKYHFQLYRKRPVYWPLQSPRKKFTVWVFHERLTKDSLFGIRKIVDDRLNLLERQTADKRKELAEGNRRAAKNLDKLLEFGDDLREFSNQLKEIVTRGYTPHIDDGVLINAAPLHPLLPSWPEARKAWKELENGEYEWSYQAMDHWPDRVKAECTTDKSLAIAHGLV
jgi:hypothetical protein